MYRILYIPTGCFVDYRNYYSYHKGNEPEEYIILKYTTRMQAENGLNEILNNCGDSFLLESKPNEWYHGIVMRDEFEIVKVD